MTDKAKEARRAYKRQWQRNNPDRVKKYQENYWNKRAEAAEGEPANTPDTATV